MASRRAQAPGLPSPLHEELTRRAARWLAKTADCSVIVSERVARFGEAPDVIGWRGDWSFLVEVKVSAEDFRADRKKAHRRDWSRGLGFERWYLTPPDTIRQELVPLGWGLLEAHRGLIRRVVYPPASKVRGAPAVMVNGIHPSIAELDQVAQNERAILLAALRTANSRGTT